MQHRPSQRTPSSDPPVVLLPNAGQLSCHHCGTSVSAITPLIETQRLLARFILDSEKHLTTNMRGFLTGLAAACDELLLQRAAEEGQLVLGTYRLSKVSA